jgi:hypothetical protein
MGVTMGQSPRALRVAANRATIAPLLAPRPLAVRGVRQPPVALARASGRLEYIEVGRCAKCRYTWRTNGNGAVRQHGPREKPCKGSGEMPSAHTVVLRDLYVPGEKWPKGRP